ncbi:hypothetical protein CC86DRAFT_407363 [Ophiobolus disseminans]|uniref:Uncharacterized protein n=1 Tax=Ophiobolus disseminans TaxID=1469910 RepID=A0A6A6ZVP4_9PLEO|nr:hypothetical protein CC86DRAFT_407363 [Ophiobolus disseminans]
MSLASFYLSLADLVAVITICSLVISFKVFTQALEYTLNACTQSCMRKGSSFASSHSFASDIDNGNIRASHISNTMPINLFQTSIASSIVQRSSCLPHTS